MYSFRDVFNLICRHNNPAIHVHFWPPYQFHVKWFPATDWKVLSFHLSIFCLFLSLSQCARKLIVCWISHQYHYQVINSRLFTCIYLWLHVVIPLNCLLPQGTFCIIAVVSVLTLIFLSISYILRMFSSHYLYVFFD